MMNAPGVNTANPSNDHNQNALTVCDINIDCGVGRAGIYQCKTAGVVTNYVSHGSIENRLPLLQNEIRKAASMADVLVVKEVRLQLNGINGKNVPVLDPVLAAAKEGMGDQLSGAPFVIPYNDHGYSGTGDDLRFRYVVLFSKKCTETLGGAPELNRLFLIDRNDRTSDHLSEQEQATLSADDKRALYKDLSYGDGIARCAAVFEFPRCIFTAAHFYPFSEKGKLASAEILTNYYQSIWDNAGHQKPVIQLADENRFSDIPGDKVHQHFISKNSVDFTSKMVLKQTGSPCSATFRCAPGDQAGLGQFDAIKKFWPGNDATPEEVKSLLIGRYATGAYLALLIGQKQNEQVNAGSEPSLLQSFQKDVAMNAQAEQMYKTHGAAIDKVIVQLGLTVSEANELMARNGFPVGHFPLDNVRFFGQGATLVDDRIEIDSGVTAEGNPRSMMAVDVFNDAINALEQDRLTSAFDHSPVSFKFSVEPFPVK